jgi:hypothetical protein
MAKAIPARERLNEIFRFDAEQGALIRKVSVSSRAQAGAMAGSLHKGSGYRVASVDGVIYREHVLIWFMIHGEWLPRRIDHEDRNRSNNRLGNMRKATESQQRQNTALRSDNTSGARGVHSQAGKFVARIRLAGKEEYLGRFTSLGEAAEAARNMRLKHFGQYAPAYDLTVGG